MNLSGRILVILVLAFGSLACKPLQEEGVRKYPLVLEQKELSGLLEKLGDHVTFSYSGIAFMEGKLFAGTNIGVLEIDPAGSSRLFKWSDVDDVVGQPWLDTAGSALWFLHSGRQKLVRYNRAGWSDVSLPKEVELTRGDMLNGIEGVGAKTGFWLKINRAVWRWNGEEKWERLEMPEFDCSFNIFDPTDRIKNSGCLAGFLPFSDANFVVTHWRSLPPGENHGPIEPDRLQRLDGEGNVQILNVPTPWKFVTDERFLRTGNDRAFVPSRNGELIQISPGSISYITTPGIIGTLIVTPNGDAVAYFPGLGIFEWNGHWEKLFSEPKSYSPDDYFFFLAKDEERLAFAVTPKRPGKQSDGSQLWIAVGKQLVEYHPF